jgi:hypothetical protein
MPNGTLRDTSLRRCARGVCCAQLRLCVSCPGSSAIPGVNLISPLIGAINLSNIIANIRLIKLANPHTDSCGSSLVNSCGTRHNEIFPQHDVLCAPTCQRKLYNTRSHRGNARHLAGDQTRAAVHNQSLTLCLAVQCITHPGLGCNVNCDTGASKVQPVGCIGCSTGWVPTTPDHQCTRVELQWLRQLLSSARGGSCAVNFRRH